MRWLLAAAMIITGLGPAAALDPQASEPYRWVVLLRTPKHPLFDAAYRLELAREIRATLEPGLGLLGSVEVIDLAEPGQQGLARQFAEEGWPALEPNAARPLDGVKYHGLNVELRGRAFLVEARQWDGFAGLATPMLRSQIVRSRDRIARAAGMLLEPDFAPGGTVEFLPDDASHVMLELRGHALGGLEGRVKPGDVFAVSVLREQAGDGGNVLAARPVPFTFLRVAEPVKDGRCKCSILTKWTSPFGREVRRSAGVRALRWPTVTSPIRVRVVDRAGKPHERAAQLTIAASDVDFNAKPGPGEGFEWRDGEFRSLRPLTGIACIRLGIGADRPQLYPVPIFGDEPITLTFEIDQAAERRALFLRECMDIRGRITELIAAQEAMLKGISALLDQSKNREALARAEAGHAAIAAGREQLAEDVKHLLGQPGADDPAAKDVLETCGKRLTAVERGQAKLTERIAELKEAIANADDPANLEPEFRRRELAKRIGELLARGDVPEALAAYDMLIELSPANAELKDEREKLRRDWTPKDEAHRAARDCIRMLGTAKDAAELRAALEAIKKSLPVLKARKDRLGLRKLQNTFEPAIGKLNELLRAVDGSAQTEELLQTGKELQDILIDLEQYNIVVRHALKELGESTDE